MSVVSASESELSHGHNQMIQEEAELLYRLHNCKSNQELVVKSKYLNFWVFTVSLGMFQFGYAMLIMNPLLFTLCSVFLNKECSRKNIILFNTLVTTAVPVGAFVGSNIAGWLVKKGRRKSLIYTNVLLVISVALMISYPLKEILLIGRLLYGVSVGLFSTISSIFVREIVPNKDAGLYGAFNQFMITFGIMVAAILGMAVPDYNKHPVSYQLTWRFLFAGPIVFGAIQVTLLMVYFKKDSPTYYKINKNYVEEMETYWLIYSNPRSTIIRFTRDDEYSSSSITTMDADEKIKTIDEPPSVFDLFRPPYRKALIVGK